MDLSQALALNDTTILYFFIYAILGWCCEVVYCSVPAGHFINRGFLNGPYCPIYGFGALVILAFLEPFFAQPVLVFLLGILATSALEYFTSWLMEKLFHARWWDYSQKKFNLKGRICLQNSLMFGALGLILVYFIHPAVSRLIHALPAQVDEWLASILVAGLLIDLIIAILETHKFTEKLRSLPAQAEAFAAEVKLKGEELKERGEELKVAGTEKRQALAVSLEDLNAAQGERRELIKAHMDEFSQKLFAKTGGKPRHRRLTDAFPSLRLSEDSDAPDIYREALKNWRDKIKGGKSRVE